MVDLDWNFPYLDPSLFMGESLQPIRFTLSDHPKRDLIKHVIKLSGGCLLLPTDSKDVKFRLNLADKNSFETLSSGNGIYDVFDLKYVHDCLSERKLIKEILSYRLNKESQFNVTNEDIIKIIRSDQLSWRKFQIGENLSEEEDSLIDESINKAELTNSKFTIKRPPYMKSEQQEIIDYFINHNAYGAFRGNKIWQEMEKQKVCRGSRSWQSMRKNFIRQVFPRLDAYKVSSEQIKKFKSHSLYESDTESSENEDPEKESMKNKPASSSLLAEEYADTWNNIIPDSQGADDQPSCKKSPNSPSRNLPSSEAKENQPVNVDMSLESNHDDDERNDESDSNNDPEFSKEFDEKMFRAVHRRLNSDDFWQYVRFETEDLRKDISQYRARFFSHIIPNYSKFTENLIKPTTRNEPVTGQPEAETPSQIIVDSEEETSQQTQGSKVLSRLAQSFKDQEKQKKSSQPRAQSNGQGLSSDDKSSTNDDSILDSVKGGRSNLSKFYRKDEDLKILKYIIENNRYQNVNGIALWRTMETRNVCEGRSSESMKERFRKKILPNIHTFSKYISIDAMNKFRCLLLRVEKKMKKTSH